MNFPVDASEPPQNQPDDHAHVCSSNAAGGTGDGYGDDSNAIVDDLAQSVDGFALASDQSSAEGQPTPNKSIGAKKPARATKTAKRPTTGAPNTPVERPLDTGSPQRPTHWRNRAADDWLRFVLLETVWPVLHRPEVRRAKVASVSLTARADTDMHWAMSEIAQYVARAGGSGLFSIDVSWGGRPHIYGVVVIPRIGAVLDHWCLLTHTEPDCQKEEEFSGWPEHARGRYSRPLLGDAAHVLTYALKPWPQRYGRRDLDRDVIAVGLFAAPWKYVQSRFANNEHIAFAEACEVQRSRALVRACPRCGKLIPSPRGNTRWCSERCKKAASAKKIRANARAARAREEHRSPERRGPIEPTNGKAKS